MKRVIVVLALSAATALANAQDEDPLAGVKKGQPKPVADLIERIVGCNHWSGEPPYDADRAKEIKKAIEELRCDQLSADEAKITKKYPGPEVGKAINAAKAFSY
jgi:hypothetical protein